jgi:hypothetical protein
VEGDGAGDWIAFAREAGGEVPVVVVPRRTEPGEATVSLPEEWTGREWENALTGESTPVGSGVTISDSQLPWKVWLGV